tara:strand:- start:156 stop:353 length:198 start_codon:yes stop_codon:yes gene_type:complete
MMKCSPSTVTTIYYIVAALIAAKFLQIIAFRKIPYMKIAGFAVGIVALRYFISFCFSLFKKSIFP